MSKTLEHYQFLHQIPELGFTEFKTAAYIADTLTAAGFTVTRNVNGTTGVIAELNSGQPGPVLALRADMDALGHIIDGAMTARHTCGHDGHSSVILATAQDVIKEGIVKRGRLKLIFQPAEELGTGALAMVDAGVMDDVDMLLGFHVRPQEECAMGLAVPAMYYSACAAVEATITGVPAHAARPHLGVNALDAAVGAVQAVNTIHLAPNLTYSVKATRFVCDAGVTNSIPAQARVCWDLRTQFNEPMEELQSKVIQAIKHSVAAIGASADITVFKQMPAAIVDEDMTALIADAIVEVLGKEGLTEPKFTPGSEDFFHYPRQRPTIKTGFWGLGANLTPGLHHPDMHFDTAALDIGVSVFKVCVKKILGHAA